MTDALPRACIYCTADLGRNPVIEHQPIGERLAFDEEKGRLWVICAHCLRWNLVPFDRRWEAIEACERLYRVTATRFATDQIGMARTSSGLTLIRVGRPVGQEFASWRYGESFRIRRRRTRIVTTVAGVPLAAMYASSHVMRILDGRVSSIAGVLGAGVMVVFTSSMGMRWGRDLATSIRQRLPVRSPETNRRVTLRAKDVQATRLVLDDDIPALVVAASGRTGGTELRFTGETLDSTLVRVLGKLNAADGSRGDLEAAVRLLTDLQRTNPEAPLPVAARMIHSPPGGVPLKDVSGPVRLALEMRANEDTERQLLAGELRFLERQWREADALAAIADGLLLPSLDALDTTTATSPVALPPERP